MNRFVKIVPNDFSNATRDKRELSTVAELGFDIIVAAKGNCNEKKELDGYKVQYLTTKPLKGFKYAAGLNRIAAVFIWAFNIRKLKADYISCHDIIALSIGWISTWFTSRTKRPKLIYEAHEFEAGRNTKRSKFISNMVIFAERFLIKKCVLSIMVNDSIAEEVQKLHGLKKKPLVVRNMATYWAIDINKCIEKHKSLCNDLKLSTDTFIVMYHGGVLRNRGIENLLYAISRTDGTAAVILGSGEDKYIEELKQLTGDLKIEHRVLFHKAVPVSRLWEFTGAADLGFVMIQSVCKSYYLSLPNKLFENIQSGTPVIASDFPEIKKVVEEYKIGLCCDPEDVKEIAKCIETFKNNKKMYDQFKNNTFKAKEVLCWEKERKILADAYREILHN